jgi:hypothetical protein
MSFSSLFRHSSDPIAKNNVTLTTAGASVKHNTSLQSVGTQSNHPSRAQATQLPFVPVPRRCEPDPEDRTTDTAMVTRFLSPHSGSPSKSVKSTKSRGHRLTLSHQHRHAGTWNRVDQMQMFPTAPLSPTRCATKCKSFAQLTLSKPSAVSRPPHSLPILSQTCKQW